MAKKEAYVEIDKQLRNRLKANGAPEQVFWTPPVNVERFTKTVRRDRKDGGKVQSIEKDQQLAMWAQLVHEYKRPLTFGISSVPDDEMAKRCGLELMRTWIEMGVEVLWCPVYGVYQNPFRDRKTKRPDALIISNVVWDSTPQKIELCRDILEMYSGIPRVVVTTGCNALALFQDKLQYPMNGLLHLTKKRVD